MSQHTDGFPTFPWKISYRYKSAFNKLGGVETLRIKNLEEEQNIKLKKKFLATLVALDFTLVSESLGHSFELA